MTDRQKLKIALDALKEIVAHERALKGSTRTDGYVYKLAYTAANRCGYLDRDTTDLDKPAEG